MTLLLIFVMATVVLGLVTTRLDRLTYLIICSGATLTTMLYYFTKRFMT
jgi:hypothetical protein